MYSRSRSATCCCTGSGNVFSILITVVTAADGPATLSIGNTSLDNTLQPFRCAIERAALYCSQIVFKLKRQIVLMDGEIIAAAGRWGAAHAFTALAAATQEADVGGGQLQAGARAALAVGER